MVPPALPPSFMEPSGSGGSNLSVDGVSSRSPVVAPSPSSLSRRVSAPSVSSPSLLVRRLGPGFWGAHLDCQVASGLWDTRQAALSINARELLAVQLGLFQFRQLSEVAQWLSFATTPQRYIPFARGVAPGLLSSTPWLRQSCAGWSPSPSACLHSFSGLRQRPNRLPVSPSPAPTSRVVYTHDRLSVFEKTVAGSNSFFATSATHRGSIYFSPFRDPRSAGTDAFLQFWDSLQAYTFHPVAVIRVLSRSSGHPRGRNSFLWLSTGLSALGFRTWSSSRWLLQ